MSNLVTCNTAIDIYGEMWVGGGGLPSCTRFSILAGVSNGTKKMFHELKVHALHCAFALDEEEKHNVVGSGWCSVLFLCILYLGLTIDFRTVWVSIFNSV